MEVLSSLKLQETAILSPQDPSTAMQLSNVFRELWDLSWTCTDSMFLFASEFLNILSLWRLDRKAQCGHHSLLFN